MRVPQPVGIKGSLKGVQTLINRAPKLLLEALPPALQKRGPINWRSPLEADDRAEYRDGAFLDLVGASDLKQELSRFWPAKGPQWDALGISQKGDIVLVEAKAHVGEICSPPCNASPQSFRKIAAALKETAQEIGAVPRAPWDSAFYQYANRLAHLHFLRKHGKPAWLVLIYFVGDKEMDGPDSAEAWGAALTVMRYVMGLPTRHPLGRHVAEAFVDADRLRVEAS
jgi:hypothetical protein